MELVNYFIFFIACIFSFILGALLGASILYSYLVTELLVQPTKIRDHLDSIAKEDE